MKKYIYSILIILTGLISGYLLKNYFSNNTIIEFNLDEYFSEMQNTLNNSTIVNQRISFGNDTLTSTFINKYNDNRFLFFYFCDGTCTPCIQKVIELLKERFNDDEYNNSVIFISPKVPERLRESLYGKRIMNLENEKIGLDIEEKCFPFLFTIDTDMKVKNLHIINKENFEKTERFLTSLNLKI